MEQGAYLVSKVGDDRDILFQPIQTYVISESQQKFVEQIHLSLMVLRSIFPSNNERFNEYFNSIFSLCQFAVVGPSAQPEFGIRALEHFQVEIAVREAGRVKNAYMRKLGSLAAVFTVAAFFLGWHLLASRQIDVAGCSYFYLWAGCMIGVWLSFAIRKKILTFQNLALLEEDHLEPMMRLIFAGTLTVTLGLAFDQDLVTLSVGKISSADIVKDLKTAILIGVFFGVSEQALPSIIVDQATRILKLGK